MTTNRNNVKRVAARARTILRKAAREAAERTDHLISGAAVANGIPLMPGTTKHVARILIHSTKANAAVLSRLLRNGNGKNKFAKKK
jgi:hypothetical protein